MSDLLGKTSLCAPLVEGKINSCPRSSNSRAMLTASDANPSASSSLRKGGSSPAFIPSAPSKEISERRGRSTSRSASTDLLNPSPTVNRDPGPFPRPHSNTPPDGLVEPNQTESLNARVRHRCAHSLGLVDAQLSQELSLKRQEMAAKSSACEGKKRERQRVQFDQVPGAGSEDIRTCAGAKEQHLDPRNYPPHQAGMQISRGGGRVEGSAGEDEQNEKIESSTSNLMRSRGSRQRFQDSHSLLKPPVLPCIEGRREAGSALLRLQNSFSKTAAHRNFNSGTTYTVVNLNDDVVSGKKHHFFGINSRFLHG